MANDSGQTGNTLLGQILYVLKNGISLSTGDIEIGAVELKNGTDDTRGTVLAASTAAAATDTSVVVSINPGSPLVPGVAATNLGKAEDAVHASGDTGIMSLGVANEAQVAFASDGDYVPHGVDRKGNVYITGQDIDNAPQTNTKPVYNGGKAVTTSSYAPAYTTADVAGFAIDKDNGGILVNQANLSAAQDNVSSIATPDATSTYAPSVDLSGALEASSVSKASAGVFYGITGYNTGPTQWILIYNTASVPANGAITPIAWIRAVTLTNFSFDAGKFGIYCSTGICWSNSTDATLFNKTLGAADCAATLTYK